MKNICILVSLITCLLGSSQVYAKDLVGLEAFPKWFKDAVEREKKVKKKTKVEINKFNVKQTILGDVSLQDKSDNFWAYLIDIGTDSPIECYISTDYDGPASYLYAVMEKGLQGVETAYKKPVTARLNFALDTGMIGDTPYIAFDTLYYVGEGQEKLAGILKGIAAETSQSLQICIHNELGYRETFFAVAESFVNAFIKSEDNPELYESVYKMSFDGTPVGFIREQYFTDEDEDVEYRKKSSMLIPVDQASLSRADTVGVEWSTREGNMINASNHTFQNGVLASMYQLDLVDGKWRVGGELQNKEILSNLPHEGDLMSGLGSVYEFLSLLNSDKEAIELPMWSPDVDPVSVVTMGISKLKNDDEANFKFDIGPLVMKFYSDKHGIFQRGSLTQGPINFSTELMYVSGKPKDLLKLRK